jgi:signal transduction histidine kinase
MNELAAHKQLSFESRIAAAPIMISGVRVYLEEALLNLLKNSLKYTPAGGRIIFEVTAPGDRISVRIEDTGIGIPAEELPHIFEEFYRASNAKSRERKGTGLGLSIAKQIVEMHQGKIDVESVLGKGTTFHLLLPHFSKEDLS